MAPLAWAGQDEDEDYEDYEDEDYEDVDDEDEGDENTEKEDAGDEGEGEERAEGEEDAEEEGRADTVAAEIAEPGGSASGAQASRAHEEVDVPDPEPFYPENEPQLEVKVLVERALGIYFVHPPWRHVSERAEVVGREIRVHYWYSISSDPEAVACDALRWLSSGRHQWSGGAADLFDELEGAERLTLAFVNVERRRKGRMPGRKDFKRYLTATVHKDGVDAISPAAVEDILSAGVCTEFMKRTLDAFRFDSFYYERELRRGLAGR